MSCSAKPTTTAPTADVVSSCSFISTVATTVNSPMRRDVLDDGRKAIRRAVSRQGLASSAMTRLISASTKTSRASAARIATSPIAWLTASSSAEEREQEPE